MDFSKATRAQLDEYVAEHDLSIRGWSKMKVAAKRAALAGVDPGPAPRGAEKIAAYGPPTIDDLEDAPKETVTIKITDAQSNPVHLFVHGTGYWSIRIGETITLPVEAVSALRNSDVKFDEV